MTGTRTDNHTYRKVLNQKGKTGNISLQNRVPAAAPDSHYQTQHKETLRQQALVFNYIYDGVILTDLDGHIIDWNHGAERMFGYSRAEALGKTPGILHRPEDAPALTQAIADGIIEHGRWQGEITFIRKDGTMGACETIVVPFLNEGGTPVAIVRINHDITVRKEAEETMVTMNRSLQNKPRERPRNLEDMNTALRVLLRKQNQVQAETEEKVLSNIRTLITPYLSQLKQSTLSTPQKTVVEILESNLAEIVSSFPKRLSSNNVNLTPSEIRVASLIRQGKTSKEMARILCLSTRTVSFHRENIRAKLGLTNKKANLKSYLSSMDQCQF